jgi:4-aminobutyrate aminotransferase-like enzyme
MVGCEFSDPESGQPDAALTKRIARHALQEGHLILLTCGMYANVIRWIPPLIATEAEINEGLTRFEQAVAASV